MSKCYPSIASGSLKTGNVDGSGATNLQSKVYSSNPSYLYMLCSTTQTVYGNSILSFDTFAKNTMGSQLTITNATTTGQTLFTNSSGRVLVVLITARLRITGNSNGSEVALFIMPNSLPSNANPQLAESDITNPGNTTSLSIAHTLYMNPNDTFNIYGYSGNSIIIGGGLSNLACTHMTATLLN